MCRINFIYIFSFSFRYNCYIYCLNFSIFYLITSNIRATKAFLLFYLTNMKWKMLLTCLTTYWKHISYWYRNIETQWAVEPNQFFWGERVALVVPQWAFFISNVFICFNDIFMLSIDLSIYLLVHPSIHPSIHQSIHCHGFKSL